MRLLIFILLITVSPAMATPQIPLQNGVEPPELLSQTGLFASPVADLKPAPELKPYFILQALWVDFAQKTRLFYLPPGKKITFSSTEPFVFPVGTIFVKHFRMEVRRGVFVNLETRVLVRKEGENVQNYVGYTYKWEGNDARLVLDSVSPKIPLSMDASAPGGPREQEFTIPSRRQCLQCHNSSVGYVRSFRTYQLNRDTQLADFNKVGIFDRDIGDAQALEKLAMIEDESQPLEARVKSYMAVNCSHCHNPDPVAMCSFTGLDFGFSSFKTEDIIKTGYLVKGAKDQSEIFRRMSSEEIGDRMPFIGTALRDETALSVVGRWIDGLK